MGTVETCWGTGWCRGGEWAGGGAYEPRCMAGLSRAAVVLLNRSTSKAPMVQIELKGVGDFGDSCLERGKLQPAVNTARVARAFGRPGCRCSCALNEGTTSSKAALIMLDGFEILTTSGVVLWSKSYAPLSSSLINGFIRDVFIEEKVLPSATTADDTSASQHPSYEREKYTLRWASVKDLGLIFVVRMPTERDRDFCTATDHNLRPSINLFSTFPGSTNSSTTSGSSL